MAIQILRALSAATTLLAVDTDAAKLETAKRMGAQEGPALRRPGGRSHRRHAGQQGAELVLDMLGVDPTLRIAAQVARVLGHLTIVVGLGGATVRNPARQLREPAARVFSRLTALGFHP
ncbi:zinc-binding dehydrogenase [Catellatospora tritici]|uniref:zinc-binding dehydrogenase n=1 Tax=Catellatospora tritici TaxID=2851566 RepID=UPI001C2D4160|nr:zinc-binding dehydrogenase [Catellatospora tritici]MBV1854345.1 zinc-binding dehydrogenase [Catellatospora tritici]